MRKTILMAMVALFGCAATNAEVVPKPEWSGENYLKINRKIQCSTVDNEPALYRWSGRAYARVPGEADKLVFNLEGMNIRQCVTVNDAEKGKGYRLVSKEIMLYLDPETNEVLRQWSNPWTGKSVEVMHVHNDPVNGRPSFALDSDGKPRQANLMTIDDKWFLSVEVPLFYNNPLAGDYQKYVGGTYHATEIFDFNGSLTELLDDSVASAYPSVSWVRIAQWLPWMEMGSRSGLLYFNAVGSKVKEWNSLPRVIRDEIAANYPEYTAPPPGDDPRPNETSWTKMKKIIDARGETPAKSASH